MCQGCWEQDGAHRIDNEKVRQAQPLIAHVYEHSAVGGNLHIVLDDNNLGDDSLEFCAKQIANGGWKDERAIPEEDRHEWPDPPEQLAAEQACLEVFQSMTFEERVSALGLYDGNWSTR